MNIIVFILSFSVLSTSPCAVLEEARISFHKEFREEKDLLNHIEYLESNYCTEIEPYLACAVMQKAEHTIWPTSQLSHFNDGKKRLEAFIKRNPENFDGRYVRLLVQRGAPGFLGYKDNISEDKKFIDDLKSSSTLSIKFRELINETLAENF